MAQVPPRHGGNLQQAALRLGCAPEQLLDFSASLVPFAPPAAVRRSLRQALALQVYPDRSYSALCQAIALRHQVPVDAVLAVFDRESRQGMSFPSVPEPGDDAPAAKSEKPAAPRKKPNLKLVE